MPIEELILPFSKKTLDNQLKNIKFYFVDTVPWDFEIDEYYDLSNYNPTPQNPNMNFNFLEKNTRLTSVSSGTVLENTKKGSNIHNSNYLTIKSDSGIIIQYVHIKSNLNKGQKIKKGENIGELYGWDSNFPPHLHLYFKQEQNKELTFYEASLNFPK